MSTVATPAISAWNVLYLGIPQYLCSIDLFRDFWPNHNVPPTITIIPGEDGFPFIYSAQHKMISGEKPGVRSGTKSSGER